MGWNPANWAITDTLQGQEGGYTVDNNGLFQLANSLTDGGLQQGSDIIANANTAYNPVQVSGSTTGSTGQTAPTTTTTTSPTPDQIKAQQDEATRQALKGNVSGIIQGLTGIYDQLYGAINSGVGEAGIRLQDRYTKETGALGDTFNQELPKIGMGYASRGLYDSSYRVQGEADATSGFDKQIGGLGDQLQLDQQAIGAKALEQKAKYQADQGGVNAILARINEVTDIGELTQLRNELEAKQRTLESDKATYANSDAQKAAYESVAGTGDTSANLISTLQTIMNGSAPTPLKKSTAMTIIANSGLAEEEKKKLADQVTASV